MLGRDREREALDRLLDGVRGGRGGVLVVHGEPGVGKTALLEYTARAEHEFRVAKSSERRFRTAFWQPLKVGAVGFVDD